MGLREEWIKALEMIEPPNNPDALFSSELAVLWGCSVTQAKLKVKKLVSIGKAKIVKKRHGHNAYQAYILIKETPNGHRK